MAVLIYDQVLGSWWQDLQGLQELDYRILIVFGKLLEGLTTGQCFTRVSHNRFAHCGKLPVMKEEWLIRRAPKFPGEEFLISGKEGCRSRRVFCF